MTGFKDLGKLRRSTLTKNIVALLLIFGIAPLAILFFVFQNVFIFHEKEGITNLQKEIAIRVAENISGYIDQRLGQVKVFGRMLQVGQLSSPNLLGRLDDFLMQHPEFDQVTVLDDQGREIVKAAQDYTYRAFELEDRSADPVIQTALAGQSVTTPVELLADSRIPRMRLILPLTNVRDRVIGVLEARMNLLHLWGILAKANIGANRDVYVIDPGGRLIAGQGIFLMSGNKDLSSLPIVQNFVSDKFGIWEYLGLNKRQVIGASASVPATGWG